MEIRMRVAKHHLTWRSASGLVLAFLAGIGANAQWMGGGRGDRRANAQESTSKPAPPEHWLSSAADEQRRQLENHLRGLDVAMMEIGHRFNEIYFAGQDRNWPYAQYQIEKIDLALRLALERRPKRMASAKPFLEETIPFVKKAIQTMSSGTGKDDYEGALERLRMDCMKCHVAENVPHFTVYPPEGRESPVRPPPKMK